MSSAKILDSQLRLLATVWKEIKGTPLPADRWLGNYFHRNRKKIGARDRRFVSEAVYSLFRHKRYYEAWAEQCRPADRDFFLSLLAAAFEGLISEDDFTRRLSGAGTRELYESLRNHELIRSDPPLSGQEALALQYSFPLWLVRKWVRAFGDERCNALLGAFSDRPPLVIRANGLKISRERLIARFAQKGICAEPTAYSRFGIRFRERQGLFGSDEFRSGLFEIQDEGSQLVCEWVDPAPGTRIWDMCAGGGGKSLAFAALMRNKGRILATDIRPKKLVDLKKRARRAGVFNIFPADLNRLGETKMLQKGVDKILVDAPCSGTGTLRRNPDAKWKLKETVFLEYQRDQIRLLEQALPYLRKGGRLYYVTCSLEPEENEEVVTQFLGRHPGIRLLIPQMRSIPGVCLHNGCLRFWPDESGMDGFFMASMERVNDGV